MSIHAGLEYIPGKYDLGRGSTKIYSLNLNESNLRDETLTHISASERALLCIKSFPSLKQTPPPPP